jgi:TonB-linked SusC/RagA family outer membrane protein
MKALKALFLVVCFLTVAPALAIAQDGTTISGRVTNAAGAPIPGANVFIQGMGIGTQTDANGRYSFAVPSARVRGQSVIVTARLLGFTAQTAAVTLTPGEAIRNFTLTDNPFELGEVVVTGAGTTSQVEKLGNVRNKVDSSVIARSNEMNIVNAIAGKAPNVEVQAQSGEPGASSFIRIRGAKTIGGTGQPLFVVDGQPIDNSTITTNGSTQSTVSSNRASDINPDDIASLEILKGPAAAAIYGARAGQGVVLITTKSGQAGETRYSLRSVLSSDKVSHGVPLQTTYGQGSRGAFTPCAVEGCRLTSGTWGPKLAAGTPIFDHFGELFRTGSTIDNTLSVSGGSDRTTFYLSGSHLNQVGTIIGPNNSYQKTSFRLKGTHRVTDRFTVGGNISYIDDRGEYIQKGSNISGLLLGALRTPPEFDNRQYLDPVYGLHRSYRYPRPSATSESNPVTRGYDNPYFVVNRDVNSGQVGRSIGNVDLSYIATDWLTLKEQGGADYYTDERVEALPLTSSTFPKGQVVQAKYVNLQLDHNFLAIAQHTFNPSLAATFTLGQGLNSRHFKQIKAQGQGLIAPTPYTLDNTIPTNLTTAPFESLVHDASVFGQATVDIFDQLYLTAALRNDGSSTFGESKKRNNFPKASAAWEFTKKTGDFGGALPYGKMRIAYGETGQEPGVYSTLSGLTTGVFNDGFTNNGLSTSQNGFGGLVTQARKPQSNLGPERSKELETGFDLGLFRNRADVGFTYYNDRTIDVILLTPAPASTGYTQQASNAATITNRGTEVTLNIRPFTTEMAAWEIGFQYGRNRNLVKDLKGAGEVDIAAGSFNGAAGAAVEGYPLGVLRGQDFARCGLGLVVDGVDIDKGCGSAGAGALYLDATGFPVVDPTVRVIADPQPKWTGSISTGLTIRKNLRLSGLLDIKKGGESWNGTKGALYFFGKHKDTEVRDVMRTFGKDYMPGHPGASGAVAGPGVNVPVLIDQDWYQGEGGGFGDVSRSFMENSGYVKLREVSLGYNLSSPWLTRGLGFSSVDLKVAGRNLHTWTKYTGIDPETNLGGAAVTVRGIDYFNNPQTRSVVFTIGLNR